MTVTTTWTSLRRPFLKVGRSGRSINRQVRIASSVGRPSRRKNDPGMRPTEYMRSSTSTVSGKKSNWSFGFFDAVVALSSNVPPSRETVTDPAACRASRPVSKVTVRVPCAPLSMTASAVAIWVPDTGASCSEMDRGNHGRRPVAVFDRGPRGFIPTGATTEDRRRRFRSAPDPYWSVIRLWCAFVHVSCTSAFRECRPSTGLSGRPWVRT